MAALTKARKTKPVFFTLRAYKMKADAVIYPGGIVCIDATGYAIAGETATGLVTKGIAAANADNVWDNTGGADGAKSVVVMASQGPQGRIAYWLGNASAGDAVTQAEVGRIVYVKDDQTVMKTSSGASPAGKCLEVSETDGVLVEFVLEPLS